MGWALGIYMAEQPLIERFNLRSRLRFNVETEQIWLDENRIELKGLFQVPGPVKVDESALITKQKAFGYTLEDINMVILSNTMCPCNRLILYSRVPVRTSEIHLLEML